MTDLINDALSVVVPVALPFKLSDGDESRFLSATTNGRQFVFQRRHEGQALSYIWLDGEVLEVKDGESASVWKELIEERLSAVAVIPDPSLPPFQGGAIGFFGYEALAAARCGQTLTRQSSGTLPLAIGFMKTFAIIDHNDATGFLIELAAQDADANAIRTALSHRLGHILNKPVPLSSESVSAPWSVDVTQETYRQRISETQRLIASGAIEQAIISIGLSVRADIAPSAAFEALLKSNPSPHAFLIGSGDFSLFGASPLMHLAITGRRVTIETDAGTRPVGHSEEENLHFASELIASQKDDIEQKIIAQATLMDLESIAVPGTVRIVVDREVRRFSHTMHLYTVMEGERRSDISSLAAIIACAPAAAVVGFPKDTAIDVIHSIEGTARGPYGGVVALIGYDGTLDSTVVLRSVWKDGSYIHLRSGGGITTASTSDGEFDEAMQKAKTVLKILNSDSASTQVVIE